MLGKTFLVLVILLSNLLSYTSSDSSIINDKTFILNGKLEGFVDGTKLFVEYLDSEKISDTVVVVNNGFTLKGNYPQGINLLRVVLRDNDYTNYKYFYLDGDEITIEAKNGDFQNAVIKGSTTQKDVNHYELLIEKEQKELDRLSELSFKLPKTEDKEVWDSIFKIKASMDKITQKILSNYTGPFIKSKPNSHYSLDLLSSYHKTMGVQLTKDLYKVLPLDFKNSKQGLEIKRYIELNKDVKIGDIFTDIEQKDQEGILRRLSDSKGKYVLLEFWASNCGPCRKENPFLKQLYEKYKENGFEVYAVSSDTKESLWKKAIQKDESTWINVSELNGEKNSAFLIYGVYEMPTNYLIDPDGIIIAKNLRRDSLKLKLEQIFNK